MTPTVCAALWMIGSIGSFSTMAVAGRELSARFDTFEVMLYRSVIGVIIVLSLAWATGAWRQINTRNFAYNLSATSRISPGRTYGSSPCR